MLPTRSSWWITACVAVLAAAAGCSSGRSKPLVIEPGLDPAIEARVQGLLDRMTLEEKADQKHGSMQAPSGLYLTPSIDRLGIPGLAMADGPRGVGKYVGNATAFPVSMARAASWDPALEEQVGEAIGDELAAYGGNVLLAPCINVLRHPGWGRAQETYGEDPRLLAAFGVAFIEGAQQHVMASVKHFVANSIEDTRYSVNVSMDDRTLREVYLPAFKAAVRDANVASVMSAYNSVRGYYMDENAELLGILKNEWHFHGFVESDWFLGTHSTVDSALAGLDIEMPIGLHFGPPLVAAVQQGQVPEQVLDDSVRRILRRQLEYHLDDPPPPPPMTDVESPAHLALARQAAVESMVLLKNDASALPLDAGSLTSLAVAGSLADVANLGDHGSSDVTPTTSITPLQGLIARADPGTVTQVAAGDVLSAADQTTVANADAAVVVVGLTAADEGENIPGQNVGDRTTLALHPEQVALINAVAALNQRTIVVVEGGSAITMEGWIDTPGVSAVVMAWYPGMEGGAALADLLFGDANFSGKLPLTIPTSEAELPPFDTTSTQVTYGYFHGYRYVDHQGTTPRFPFGYGLSYTTFAYSNLSLQSSTLTKKDSIRASFDVTNTGTMAGDEVAELYVGYEGSAVERDVRDLEAFTRVQLAPGETKTVTLDVPVRHLAYWDVATSSWVVEPITYDIEVGGSERDLPLQATVTITP